MPQYYPYYRGDDPRKAAMSDREWAYDRGDQIFSQNVRDEDIARAERENRIREADDLYANPNNLQYTTAEENRIARDAEARQYLPTDADSAKAFLTANEMEAIKGSPNAWQKYYDPNARRAIENKSEAAQNSTLTDFGNQMDAGINEDFLRTSPEMGKSLGENWQRTSDQTMGALDSGDLSLSADFGKAYPMTPEEQQRIVTAAGLDVGDRYQAGITDLARKAAGSGIDPLGVVAAQSRMRRESAGESADAMTKARVAADEAAAERLRQGEMLRLNAAQYQAGEKARAALDLGKFGADTATTWEQMRQAGERDISDREMQAAKALADSRLNVQQGNAARAGAMEADIQAQGMTGAQQEEAAWQARQRELALNRQGAELQNQENRYQRGMGVDTALSGRYGKIADTRLAGQQAKMGYVTGQQTQSNANYNAAADRAINTYGTEGQLAARGTATQVESQLGNKKMGFGTSFKTSLGSGLGSGVAGSLFGGGGAEGGVFTKPTYKVLGEYGPEMVIPIGRSKMSEWAVDDDKPAWQRALGGFASGGIMGALGSLRKPKQDEGQMVQDWIGKNPQPLGTPQVPPPPPVDYPQGGMAEGGIVDKPGTYLLGEDGPEAVIPLTPRAKNRARPSLMRYAA